MHGKPPCFDVRPWDLTYHALLDSTVGDNIDDVSDLVLLEVCSESDHTLLLEVAGEGCSTILATVSLPYSNARIISATSFHLFL